jgi:hypothetical protein
VDVAFFSPSDKTAKFLINIVAVLGIANKKRKIKIHHRVTENTEKQFKGERKLRAPQSRKECRECDSREEEKRVAPQSHREHREINLGEKSDTPQSRRLKAGTERPNSRRDHRETIQGGEEIKSTAKP